MSDPTVLSILAFGAGLYVGWLLGFIEASSGCSHCLTDASWGDEAPPPPAPEQAAPERLTLLP
jgi:hypothetical protein